MKGLPLQHRPHLIESPLPGHARLASACSIIPKHFDTEMLMAHIAVYRNSLHGMQDDSHIFLTLTCPALLHA